MLTYKCMYTHTQQRSEGKQNDVEECWKGVKREVLGADADALNTVHCRQEEGVNAQLKGDATTHR